MKLIEHQKEFLIHTAYLILKVRDFGLTATGGELLRTKEQQAIYFRTGKSKTLLSAHIEKLAIDLNLFKGDRFATIEEIRPLGEYWKALHPLNIWGGDWPILRDGPHFERKIR